MPGGQTEQAMHECSSGASHPSFPVVDFDIPAALKFGIAVFAPIIFRRVRVVFPVHPGCRLRRRATRAGATRLRRLPKASPALVAF